MIKRLEGSYNRDLFPHGDKCLFKVGVIPGEEILMQLDACGVLFFRDFSLTV